MALRNIKRIKIFPVVGFGLKRAVIYKGISFQSPFNFNKNILKEHLILCPFSENLVYITSPVIAVVSVRSDINISCFGHTTNYNLNFWAVL